MLDLTLIQIAARLIRGEYLPRAGRLPQYEIARLEEAHKMLGLSVKREGDRLRDEARAEAKRLRRLALAPMAPGEVPTEEGWYVAQIRRGSRPEPVELEHAAAPIGAPSVVWAAGEAVPFEAGDVHRWLARIPVEALGEVADG